MKIKVVIPLLALSLLILVSAAWARETGEIRGRVTDEKGEFLPGVAISLQSPSLQGVRTAVTSLKGEFHFPLLPVGTYRLTAELAGFPSLIHDNIIVRLGRMTDVYPTLYLSTLTEEITVTAPAPLIDKNSTDTSFTISSEDMETSPVQNRSVADLVKFVPGVTGVRANTKDGTGNGGLPSFRGEGEEGNNWIVDGLSISGVRLKNAGVALNYDALEEIQVISDPFSPEYGSAYGGIINMVTKSGGNQLSGELALIFRDKNLQAPRRDQLSIVSEPEYYSNANTYLNLGGPIIKDKLWFFISNNLFSDIEETTDATLDYLSVPAGKRTFRFNNLFTKLSFAPHVNHTLSLTSLYQTTIGQSGGTGIPEMYTKKTFTDGLLRLNYRGILNDSTFVEAGLGVIDRGSLESPVSGELDQAMYFIEDLGRNLHNSYGNITDDQRRLDFSCKLTTYVEPPGLGSHELTLGFEYYSIRSQFRVDFSGRGEDLFPGDGFDAGTKYYFSSWEEGFRTPTLHFEYGNFDFINSSRGIGLYVKDKITIGRMTLMAGFRSQTQLNLDNNGNKLWSWNLGDFFSPRLSLAYDLTGDGRNIVKVGWGVFSDLITTMPLGLLNSGAGLTFRTYHWTGTPSPTPAELHDPQNWAFENEQKTQPFVIADSVQPNFLSRLLFEYDRKLGDNWALMLRYVRTRAVDLLEVLAVFDPVTQYKFLYDNFELKRRNYSGFEVELLGKIGRNFFLKASYNTSSAMGTNPGQSESGSWSQEEGSTNYIGLFGNHIFIPALPGLTEIKDYYDKALGGLGGRGVGDEGWYGKLPYSVDHNLKINAVWVGPWRIVLSGAFEYISGYYWEKLGYVPFFGGYYSYPEGRGTQTTPGHTYLDLGLEKAFRVLPLSGVDGLTLNIRLDVFNVFDSQRPVSYVKEDIPLFGQVWGRQQPRQARMMVKIKF